MRTCVWRSHSLCEERLRRGEHRLHLEIRDSSTTEVHVSCLQSTYMLRGRQAEAHSSTPAHVLSAQICMQMVPRDCGGQATAHIREGSILECMSITRLFFTHNVTL